mmetsp:Transcript_486/g.1350  ORF Transcript_486/g.1350 Transcript_486/m.1350 type:complete len:300 (-) Transcript_486:88-987(-)
MKITHGSFARAYPNISLINRADSPMYLSTIALETTFKNEQSMLLAIAFANNVFPVPGGPYNNTPFGGAIPTRKNSSGFIKGNSMLSRNSLICSPKPPMEEYSTFPGASLNMLNTTGSTSRGNARIIVNVVISNVTLVPFTNFSRSSFDLHPTIYRGPELAFTINLSSSNCLKTSPMICPIDCNAVKSPSVLSNCFFASFNSIRRFRTRASSSLCWSISRVNSAIACCFLGSSPSPPSSPPGAPGTSGFCGATSVMMCSSIARFLQRVYDGIQISRTRERFISRSRDDKKTTALLSHAHQ